VAHHDSSLSGKPSGKKRQFQKFNGKNKGFLRRKEYFITLRRQSSQLRKLGFAVACTGSFVISRHQESAHFYAAG
jgi:hypothetical protein